MIDKPRAASLSGWNGSNLSNTKPEPRKIEHFYLPHLNSHRNTSKKSKVAKEENFLTYMEVIDLIDRYRFVIMTFVLHGLLIAL